MGPDDGVDLTLLRDTARQYLASPRDERALADMGWTGLLVAEEHDGAGWRPAEAVAISRELGRARNPTAWAGSTVCAGALSRWAGGAAQERWLSGLLDGTVVGAVALEEAPCVVGAPDVVVLPVGADLWAVDGATVVAAEDPTTMDADRDVRHLAALDAAGERIGDAQAARAVAALFRLLVAADAIGALASARERLVEHLRTRIAFEQPLASFQVIQHRLVELLVFELRSDAILARAARESAADDPAFPRTAAAAHAFVMAGVVPAVDECVQLSGGIGFTWEYPLHHELRRTVADSALAGSARASRTAMAELDGW